MTLKSFHLFLQNQKDLFKIKKKKQFAKKKNPTTRMAKAKRKIASKDRRYSRKKIMSFLKPAKEWAYRKGQCRKGNRKNKTKNGVNRCALQKTRAMRLYERLVRDLNTLKRLSFEPGKYEYI